MISQDKLPTFAAVALGTGILGLLLAAFALKEARVAGVATAGLMQGSVQHMQDIDAQVKTLEARIAALEAARVPPPAPAEPAPAEPAPAP